MHRRVEAFPIVVASLLLTGGWVCESNAANPCPGALTCGIEVATVCCPFGSGAWCDGCAVNADGCSSTSYVCNDESRVLDCSFSASIGSAQCLNPRSQGPNVVWTLQVSGPITGCGQETAFISGGTTFLDGEPSISCGAWTNGVFGGCTPNMDNITTTTWRLEQVVGEAPGMSVTTHVEIQRAHGANPVLAAQDIVCGP